LAKLSSRPKTAAKQHANRHLAPKNPQFATFSLDLGAIAVVFKLRTLPAGAVVQ
jgi:hypothetical protein